MRRSLCDIGNVYNTVTVHITGQIALFIAAIVIAAVAARRLVAVGGSGAVACGLFVISLAASVRLAAVARLAVTVRLAAVIVRLAAVIGLLAVI